jgi:hypothetical protein
MTYSEFSAVVKSMTARCADGWVAAATLPPVSAPRFTATQKLGKEEEISEAIAQIQAHARRKGRLRDGKSADHSAIRATMVRLLLDGGREEAGEFFEHCEESARLFAARAAEFDHGISETEILQATRNLWVFNSLQFSAGRSVGLSPSSFAYSLLYPYTDNVLDDPSCTDGEKKALVRDLGKLLREGSVPRGKTSGRSKGFNAWDAQTSKLEHLIRMISDEFPLDSYPCVHFSLRAIHDAQCGALDLCRPSNGREELGLLHLSVDKGGTSVLADGYLVSGSLTPAEKLSSFAYGVLLQLIDDLQDLEEDAQRGHSTAFTRALEEGVIEKTTNKLFHYMPWILACMKGGGSPRENVILQLVERTCQILVFEAIDRYRQFYPENYLVLIEEFSPVRLSYFGEVRALSPRPIPSFVHLGPSRGLAWN